MEASHESAIEMTARVSGENCRANMSFENGQEITDFHIGIAVPGVACVQSLADQGLGLVEQQHLVG